MLITITTKFVSLVEQTVLNATLLLVALSVSRIAICLLDYHRHLLNHMLHSKPVNVKCMFNLVECKNEKICETCDSSNTNTNCNSCRSEYSTLCDGTTSF